jgi:DNA-binding response OmpR family regulator
MSEKKILIVDDDKDLVQGLSLRLKASGYNVIPAYDASSGIGAAQKQKPDVIILDIKLPAGSGFNVIERLKSLMHLAGIPVIVVTGIDPHTNRERALKAGAVAFFEKPVDNEELLAAVRKALEESIEPTQEKQPSAREEPDITRKKILIVDDDKDLLLGMNVRLKAAGYNVVLAYDAPSALSIAQREKPDVIILDIGLPGGDGFVVMERLKSPSMGVNTPVIILTARDVMTNKERALKAGAVAFLQKPADNEQLLATIQKALGGSD